jgi:mannose-1-phosphate guanylyltransferase
MENKPLILIMCGGKSLRLWPLSEYKSKNFLDIFGFSPLELTIKRFLKITDKENIFLVANQAEKKQIQRVKLVKKENVFYEPEGRNTAAAIAFSLFKLSSGFSPDRSLIIVPVDHFIKNETDFYKALKDAIALSAKGGICTLGITALEPTPKFGYIKAGQAVAPHAFKVDGFVEKPSRQQAEEFIREGNYFYNSGMFISTLAGLTEEFKKYYHFYFDFLKLFKEKKDPSPGAIAGLYKKLSNEPFDKAVMEKTEKAFMVKGNFFWKDFGSWNTVLEMLPKDASGNAVNGKAYVYQGKNNLVRLENGKAKKVLIAGLSDMVFIDTPQYSLLISQVMLDDLKAALNEFKSQSL